MRRSQGKNSRLCILDRSLLGIPINLTSLTSSQLVESHIRRIVKCWSYQETSVRVIMPLPNWFRLVSDLLTNLKYPVQHQLGMIEAKPTHCEETYGFLFISSPEPISYLTEQVFELYLSTFLFPC